MEPRHTCAVKLLPRVEAIIRAKDAGDQLYIAGQIIEASKEYSKALSLVGFGNDEGQGGYPRIMLLENRAATYIYMGRFELAQHNYLAALSILNHPWRLDFLGKLTRCYLALGNPDAALQHVNIALEIDHFDEDILQIKSCAESMLSNPQQSQSQSRKLMEKVNGLDAKKALLEKLEIGIEAKGWDNAVSAA
ncbi:hypothetical protein FRB98_003772, partial [Tulasnella sp. 332]